MQRDIARCQGGLDSGGIGTVDGKVKRIQQPSAALALQRTDIDPNAIERQFMARRFNKTTIAPERPATRQQHTLNLGIAAVDNDRPALAPFGGRRINTAIGIHGDGCRLGIAHQHRTTAGAATGGQRGTLQGDGAAPLQHQLAALAGKGSRLHYAGRLDHTGIDAVQGLGGQINGAARRLDDATRLNLRTQQRRLNLQRCATVRRQDHRLTGGQDDGPQFRPDQAKVGDLRCQQHHSPTTSLQAAFIDDGAIRRTALEDQPPIFEILVRNIQGGGDEAAYIHARPTAEHDPVGIDQDHRTGRRDRAVDHRLTGAAYPVQRHGLCIGLLEMHIGARADIEILPTDDGFAGGLIDIHHRAGTGDAGDTRLYLPSRRQRIGRGGTGKGRQCQRLRHREHGRAEQ